MAPLEYRQVEQSAILTLNRPEKLNAIDCELLSLLAEHVQAASADDSRCLIVTGAGERAFSAGADVGMFPGLTPVEAEELMRYGQDVYAALEQCPKPVIAAINGYALGGGLELALACDFRIAATHAKLGQPEITLANLPGWGGTQRLPRIVGEAVAKDMILTGRLIDADEALAIGLVGRTADGPVIDAALELAGQLSAHQPTPLALAKRAVHAARFAGQAGYEVERHAVALCFTTPEQQSAVHHFAARTGEDRKERSP